MAGSGASRTSLEVYWCYICDEKPGTKYLRCLECDLGRKTACQVCLDRGFDTLCLDCASRSVEVHSVTNRLSSLLEDSSMCTSRPMTRTYSQMNHLDHLQVVTEDMSFDPCIEGDLALGERTFTEVQSQSMRQSPLILLDFKYTLVYTSGRQKYNSLHEQPVLVLDSNFHVHVRPYAVSLLQWLLQKQCDGLCQVGFYTPFTSYAADIVATCMLEKASNERWVQEDGRPGIYMGTYKWTRERVHLFDEHHTEHSPEFKHEASQTYMHMKSLQKVSNTSGFALADTLYITCPNGVNSDGDDNLVRVDAWWPPDLQPRDPEEWRPPECDTELRRLQRYLAQMLAAVGRGGRATEYLKSNAWVPTSEETRVIAHSSMLKQ